MKKEIPTKKELLKMPQRNFKKDAEKQYDWLLIVPEGTKHSSGYMHIAIIGVIENPKTRKQKYEICAYPDDIEWAFPAPLIFGDKGQYKMGQVRTDCYYPSGIFRVWSNSHKFTVDMPLSSVTVRTVRKEEVPKLPVALKKFRKSLKK